MEKHKTQIYTLSLIVLAGVTASIFLLILVTRDQTPKTITEELTNNYITYSENDTGMNLYFNNVPAAGFDWNTTETNNTEQAITAIVGSTIFWGEALP